MDRGEDAPVSEERKELPMLRTCVCVGIGLLLAAGGVTAAQGDKTQAGGKDQEMRGKIVRVDPEKGVVVIRTGEGDKAKEVEYRVSKTTKYFGTDRKDLTDGLRFKDFRQGSDVWFRMSPTTGTNTTERMLSELRLGPSLGTPNPK